MPPLLLSARQTDDAQALWRACVALKWNVVRVHGWQVPAIPRENVAVYGEPLFAHHVAQTVGLKLQEPSLDWLPKLAPRWRGRKVRLATLAEAVAVKPDHGCFMGPAHLMTAIKNWCG